MGKSLLSRWRRVFYLPGTANEVRGALSGITALGRTKAPIDISFAALMTELDFDVNMTFAKWVGTEMDGGEPITS